MSDMKCPFCQQELEEETFSRGRVFVSCNNPNCIISDWGGCSKQIIAELIRTRKALEIAVDALKNATEYLGNQEPLVDVMAMNLHTDLSKALEQITELEQKDK